MSEKELTNPICPDCNGSSFRSRRIPPEKDREGSHQKKVKIRRGGIFHVAVVYCKDCGYVVGTAGGFQG